jgi:hypothetical protein
MVIDSDEGKKIMRICEERRATALVNNRRVTVAGGKARETDHSKHAKGAPVTARSVDDNGVFSFSLCEYARVMRALYVTVIANWRTLLCSR